MAYTTPVFNLLANVWNAGNVPADGPPDWSGVACQFYIYSRNSTSIQPCELELYTPVIQIRLPIAASGPWVDGQVFEVEAGSGRYYRARFKDRVHYGFPNEYLVAYVVQCNDEGLPLLRDIENAEPCGEPPTPEGEGEAAITITLEADGEGEVTSGPPDFVGEGEPSLLPLLDSSFTSSGSVT